MERATGFEPATSALSDGSSKLRRSPADLERCSFGFDSPQDLKDQLLAQDGGGGRDFLSLDCHAPGGLALPAHDLEYRSKTCTRPPLHRHEERPGPLQDDTPLRLVEA